MVGGVAMRLKEAMEDSIRHGMVVKHDPEDHNGCRYFPPKLTIINPRNGKKVVGEVCTTADTCGPWDLMDADDKFIRGPLYSCEVFEDLCKP